MALGMSNSAGTSIDRVRFSRGAQRRAAGYRAEGAERAAVE